MVFMILFFCFSARWTASLGFESFNGNVILKDLQLPSDNPAGGINFKAVTELTNPRYFDSV